MAAMCHLRSHPLPNKAASCIVIKLDDLMALVDKLEAQQKTASSTATKLLVAAIAELTNGEKRRAVVAG